MGKEQKRRAMDNIVNHEQKIGGERLQAINCEAHGCMDGRPVLYKVRKIGNEYKIVTSGESAKGVVEAKLPGGALGFIAVLQEVARLSLDRAIEITESALNSMGMDPQMHIDNDHGHFDVAGKTEAELIKFAVEQTGGCGFAGLIWGENAPKLVNDLKERGWLVEILDGHHEEIDAINIDKPGIAINTEVATHQEHQSFTFNRVETKKALEAIEALLEPEEKSEAFVQRSMDWYNEKFPAIAKKLRDIDSTETI